MDQEKVVYTQLKMSDQMIGALLMALQKCLLEQSDITEILRNLKIANTEIGLVVVNPPTFKIENVEPAEGESAIFDDPEHPGDN